MKFQREANNTVRFTFTIKPEQFEKALTLAYDDIKKDFVIKGFRKGHVPQSRYEAKHGVESLYGDALNHIIGDLFNQALSNKELQIVSEPRDIDFGDPLKLDRTKDFEITFIVDLKPEVKLGQYKGLKVAKSDLDVSDADVDVEITNLLNKSKSLELKDGPLAKGDTAIFDFVGSVDGVEFEGGSATNHSLEIGSKQFIPGFEEQMIGLKSGEKKDVVVKFPAEYHAEHLAGKDAVFKVTVHEVKHPVLPKLDEAWIKSLNKEGVETLAQLKEATKNELIAEKKATAKKEKTESAITQAVDNAEVSIPKSMIDREVKNYVAHVERQAKQYNIELDMFLQLSGMDKETFDKQAIDQATKHLKQSLVIDAVAHAEKIKADPKDVEARYEELAAHYNMPVEEVKKHITADLIANDVEYSSAIDLIVDSAKEE